MKKAEDSSVGGEEATPFVGGGVEQTVPKTNKKKMVILGAALLIILVTIGLVVGWMKYQQNNYLNISGLKSDNIRVQTAKDLAKKQPPKDATGQVMYYAAIATELQAGKEYGYAEHFLLTAQKTADENQLDKKQYRFYVALADLYRQMKNDSEAKEYDAKEQKFLEENYSKEVLDQMKETKPDAPRKH